MVRSTELSVRDPGGEPPGRLTTIPREVVQAVGDLVDRAVDRVLLTGERVPTAAAGVATLGETEEVEALAENVQRVVVVAVPVVRALARGARFTRIPWVLVASTLTSTTLAVRSGIRELQVIAALVADRLEREGEAPVDPGLVKRLAVDLYLEPKRVPDPSSGGLRLGRVARRWLLRGAFGRDTSGREASAVARRAMEAAERLDVETAARRWSERGRGR
jgi:hypothetical protein